MQNRAPRAASLRTIKPVDFGLYHAIFDALSEPMRLQMLRMIASTSELPCTALEHSLPVTKSTISYHVKILYRAQLIQVRKEGRYFFYKVRRDVFSRFLPGFLRRLVVEGVGLAMTQDHA